MALVLPERFEENHDSERLLYDWAKTSLPQDWVCYFNYFIDTQECDLILIIPLYGIVIIEVKGWSGKSKLKVIDQNQVVIGNNGLSPRRSPYRQARGYTLAFMEKIRSQLNKNYLVVPAVCFPKLSRNEFFDKQLDKLSDVSLVLLKEEIENPKMFCSKIEEIIKRQEQIVFNYDVFDANAVFKVRSLFEPNLEEEYQPQPVITSIDTQVNDFPYSVLVYLPSNASEEEREQEFENLVSLWSKYGTKIIWVSNENEIRYKERLAREVESRGLNEHESFQLKKGESWNQSIYHFYFYQIERVYTEPIKIVNGETEVIDQCRSFLKQMHEETFFNLEQYEVEHAPTYTNLLIKAGAGSGKTYSMISRIHFLIHQHNYDAAELYESMYLITFTKEAANNMKRRLQVHLQNHYLLTRQYRYYQLVEQVHNLHISTIHGLANRIIQKFSRYVGLGKDFRIVSGIRERNKNLDLALDEFLKQVDHETIKRLGIRMYHLKKRLKSMFSKLENKNIDLLNEQPDFGATQEFNFVGELVKEVLYQTESHTRQELYDSNNVRLSDLILKMKELLREEIVELKKYRGRIQYVFVDEFQDTDNIQIDLLKKFQEVIGFHLFIVGDVKQCIYRFRGAEQKAFDYMLGSQDITVWGQSFSFTKNYRTDSLLLRRFEKSFENWGSRNLLEYDGMLSSPLHLNEEPDDYFRRVVTTDASFEEDFIRELRSELMKLPPKEKLAILVRENQQIEQVRKLCLKNKIFVETDKGGDLFQIEPTIDFYKLVLALLHSNSPEHMINLWTTSYVNTSLSKADIQDRSGNERELIHYLTELNPPFSFEKWKTYREQLKLSPVLSVLWQIRVDSEPWKKYARALVDDPEEQLHLELFYRRNLDLIFEKLIDLGDTDHLTLNKIENFLHYMIVSQKDSESREIIDDSLSSRVICTTVHKSKGLEYYSVLVPFNDREIEKERSFSDTELLVLPSNEGIKIGYSIKKEDGESFKDKFIKNTYYEAEELKEAEQKKLEETRILYVALTRAIQRFIYFTKEDIKVNLCWGNLIDAGGLDESLYVSKSI